MGKTGRVRVKDLPPKARKVLQAAKREMERRKQEAFKDWCVSNGLPRPESEVRFHARKWRFDYAWMAPYMVALEVEGGVWTGGRHTRGSGFVKDMEKYNSATALGWRVVRVTPKELKSDATLEMLRTMLT